MARGKTITGTDQIAEHAHSGNEAFLGDGLSLSPFSGRVLRADTRLLSV